MYSFQELKNQLISLGIKKGDTLLIRADLGTIGKLKTKERRDYINFILDVVGIEGTIVGLSFTSSFFIKRNKDIVFDSTSKSYTGSFANLMLNHPEAIRSTHPTNSYVAVGKNAKYILMGHNEDSGAYEPIRKIMELDGKMLLIGCVGSSPGFTTIHLAEVDLGLHKRIIFPTLNGAYYKKNNEIKLFKRKDLGSCSSSFYKFYGFYLKNEILTQGYIGNAYTIIVKAKEAYLIDRQILKTNPKITICDDLTCMLCRSRRWDNLSDLPRFLLTQIIPKIFKKRKNN